MIIKHRSMPKNLLGLLSLSRRLAASHEKANDVGVRLSNEEAGFGGEKNFDKHMLEFKPIYAHAILHDLCLKQNGIFSQMDSILITPSFIIIFEVKNIGGKIKFERNPDRIVVTSDDGRTRTMQSPIAELERKKYLLQGWLSNIGIKMPIQCVVVFAYAKEIEPVLVPGYHITFAYQVPYYLYGLSLEEELISSRNLIELAVKMRQNHSEYNPFPMVEKWKISRDDLLPGVFCSACSHRGMKWHLRRWTCPKCGNRGDDNHIEAVAEWFYLMDKKMTNRDFREFLLVDSNDVAKRLLTKSNLQLRGQRRGSYYVLDEEIK